MATAYLHGYPSYGQPLQAAHARERYLAAAADMKLAETEWLAAQATAQREREAALHRAQLERSFLYSRDNFTTVPPRPLVSYSDLARDRRGPLYSPPLLAREDFDLPSYTDASLPSLRLRAELTVEAERLAAARAQLQREREALEQEARQIEQLKALKQRQLELAQLQREKEIQPANEERRRRHQQDSLLALFTSPEVDITRPQKVHKKRAFGERSHPQAINLSQLFDLIHDHGAESQVQQEPVAEHPCHRRDGHCMGTRQSGVCKHRIEAIDSRSPAASCFRMKETIKQQPSAPAVPNARDELSLHDLLKVIRHAVVTREHNSAPAQAKQPTPTPTSPAPFQDLLEGLLGGTRQATNDGKAAQEFDLTDIFKAVASGFADGVSQNNSPSGSAGSSSAASHKAEVKTTQPSSSSSVVEPTTNATPTVQSERPRDAATLKDQLEARLNNEYATEIRDTIQALLASLADVHKPSASSPSSSNGISVKGKAKVTESESESVPRSPTSADITRSYDTVHSIETAFVSLSDDFVFPAQLDFTPPSSPSALLPVPLPGSDAVSLSSSADSATRHLAYTARNQPIRFYEQALGALLMQLDEVDSFGNEALRSRRKEVVEKVEHALEELDREIDGRWRIKLRKDAKPTTSIPSPGPIVAADRISTSDKDKSAQDSVTGPIDGPSSHADAELSQDTLELENLDKSVASSVEDTTRPVEESVSHKEQLAALSDTRASDTTSAVSTDATVISEPSSQSVELPASASVSALPPITAPGEIPSEEPVDTFLLPATPLPEPSSGFSLVLAPSNDTEVDSDWSELDGNPGVESA